MSLLRKLVLLLASAALACAAPGLPRSAPEAQGVASTALLGFIAAAEARISSLHSFMLVRHGHVVAEGWWAPYAAGEPHELYSLSKSFTATAVGLAIADGKLSVEDPVLKFFPEEAPAKPSANLRAMRVRDLLTMSTGHHLEDIRGFSWSAAESLVRTFLALPVTHKPGTFFVYNTPATYMLSAIVQQVTGQTVRDYLMPRLFEPLGIAAPVWDASKQGVSYGGFGLNLRTEDIARFGQLYLQRGQWQGRPLVPAAWVDTATSRWMSNGSAPTSDWEQGYGFQFWRCRHGVIRGDGAHGQFCIIFPEQDAVLAITAGTRDLQGVLNVVWDKILPALQPQPLPADPAGNATLREKLAHLSLPIPTAIATPALAQTVAGARYVFPQNPQAIESLMLSPSAKDPSLTEVRLTIEGREQPIMAATGAWRRGALAMGPSAGPIAASGAWTGPDTFTFELVRYRTPFTARYELRFSGQQVRLETKPNVGPTAAAPLVGRRE